MSLPKHLDAPSLQMPMSRFEQLQLLLRESDQSHRRNRKIFFDILTAELDAPLSAEQHFTSLPDLYASRDRLAPSDVFSKYNALDFVEILTDTNFYFLDEIKNQRTYVQFLPKFWTKPFYTKSSVSNNVLSTALNGIYSGLILGHTYYWGTINYQFEIWIVFRPVSGTCQCGGPQHVTHVSEVIAEQVFDVIEKGFATLNRRHLRSGHLRLNHSDYRTSRRTFEFQFAVIQDLVLDFEGHPYFQTHKAHFVIRRVGQNEYPVGDDETLESNFNWIDFEWVKGLIWDHAINYFCKIAGRVSVPYIVRAFVSPLEKDVKRLLW